MRRPPLALTALLWLALGLGVWAEPQDTFCFKLDSATDFAVVEWHPASEMGEPHWRRADPPVGGVYTLRTPSGVAQIVVRGLQYDRDLIHYHYFLQPVRAVPGPVPVVVLSAVDGARVGLLLVLLAGVPGLAWLRGRRQRALAAQALRHQEETSELRREKTYYRVDGRPPEQIDQFTVLGQLGQGGMATVYHVRAPDGAEGALKLPVQQLVADPEFRRRFCREMELGARLRHPAVVRIDYVNPDFPPYYVMELVQGQSLDSLPGPLPVAEACDYARQILSALEYIHRHGVIHRDLKPHNVMRLKSGVLKLMDFGLALLSQDDRTRLTASGQMLGTPAYMAPEQVTQGPVDARADLYALGLMVYEMLAGNLPFPEEVMALLTQKLTQEVPPLGLARPDLSEALQSWVARMTCFDPEGRYADASEALEALNRAVPA